MCFAYIRKYPSLQARVVQRVDNSIQWIYRIYLLDMLYCIQQIKCTQINTFYPLGSDSPLDKVIRSLNNRGQLWYRVGVVVLRLVHQTFNLWANGCNRKFAQKWRSHTRGTVPVTCLHFMTQIHIP